MELKKQVYLSSDWCTLLPGHIVALLLLNLSRHLHTVQSKPVKKNIKVRIRINQKVNSETDSFLTPHSLPLHSFLAF